MKVLVAVVLFFDLYLVCLSNIQKPMVRVYSRNAGVMDQDNVLICHVTNFHPPEITIDLVENDKVMPGAQQSDLAFEDDWHFHLIKHSSFVPKSSDRFACRVTHLGKTTEHSWEPDE